MKKTADVSSPKGHTVGQNGKEYFSMKKAKKEMEVKAQEAVRKAAEAVKAANEALNEANAALQDMQAISDDELDRVSGGDSAWDNLPNPKEYPYPVDPKPNP